MEGLKALQLLETCLTELESSKGSVAAVVHQLYRAATLLEEESICKWCEIQLGHFKYTLPLKRFAKALCRQQSEGDETEETQQEIDEAFKEFEKAGLKLEEHLSIEEINIKLNESSGGYVDIGFVEEIYLDLVRTKKGNDGTYYKNNLSYHLAYVRKTAHKKATSLYQKYASLGAPASAFDVLKSAVDDRLLDISPQLAERLMIAFRRICSDNPEEWSQSLTSCRRLIEGLADALYPPHDEPVSGRAVGQAQYINRLWAFMDEAIESESNRKLAKAHVDYLGGYLERIHKLSHKGVHASLARIEAIKAVFHLYLTTADVLDYLDREPSIDKPNIHTASLNEIQEALKINRDIAKEIVKLRATQGKITEKTLLAIKGVGSKTLEKAKASFSFRPVRLEEDA